MATIGQLIPVRMKKEDMQREDVQAFRCGSRPHETPLAEWLRLHSAARIASGHKFWLYRLGTDDGPLVGYGSLTTGKVKTTAPDGVEREVKCYEIPQLALHEDYHRKPEGCAPESKYSRQIVRHLQREAREQQQRGTRERILTLYVHPDATRAQNLYLACGFAFVPGRFLPCPDIPPEVGSGYLGMDYVWGRCEPDA